MFLAEIAKCINWEISENWENNLRWLYTILYFENYIRKLLPWTVSEDLHLCEIFDRCLPYIHFAETFCCFVLGTYISMITMVIPSMTRFSGFLTVFYRFSWCFLTFLPVFLWFPLVFLLFPRILPLFRTLDFAISICIFQFKCFALNIRLLLKTGIPLFITY